MRHLLFSLAFIFQCEQTPFFASKNQTAATPAEPKSEEPSFVFQSTDAGASWHGANAGLPADIKPWRFKTDGQRLILLTEKAVFQRNASPQTASWSKQFMGYEEMEFSDLFFGPTGPYLFSYGKGIFEKMGSADFWTPADNGLEDKEVRCLLETADGSLFAGCETGLYKRSPRQNAWKKVAPGSNYVNSLVELDGGAIVCACEQGLLRSADGGETWSSALTEDGQAFRTKRVEGGALTVTEGGGSWQDGQPDRIRFSADGGKTWQRIDQNLPPQKHIHDVEQAAGALFCSTNAGVYRSVDFGKTWQLVLPLDEGEKMLFNLTAIGSTIFAALVNGC